MARTGALGCHGASRNQFDLLAALDTPVLLGHRTGGINPCGVRPQVRGGLKAERRGAGAKHADAHPGCRDAERGGEASGGRGHAGVAGAGATAATQPAAMFLAIFVPDVQGGR